ncbi:MAG: hypothetical protein Q8911_05825 [Bacillota bacterium]|nr:hypothetical protein [Bacillota bacterium]
MCGISGLFGEGDFINDQRLQAMTQFMGHRGPDEESFFISPPLAFGFSRLAIVDLIGLFQRLTPFLMGFISYCLAQSSSLA